MTDHGNLYGAFDFAAQAVKAGIKPIIGTEAYIAPGSRFDKRLPDGGNAKTDKYSHMTLWAADPTGYSNLIRLSSLASLEGYYYKPRMDRELLSRFSAGIIGTTGCPGGEVSQALERGDYALAKATAGEYAEIFGRGNFYVELMQHGIDIEKRTFPQLVKIARELDLPLVATNDLHYTNRADSTAHEVLLCVQTGATLADPTRFKFEADEFYLKSPAEMRSTFAELPEACDNTLVIAERIVPPSFAPKSLLPQFPCPEGETEERWFRKEVAAGVAWRYKGAPSEKVQAQVDYEVGVILQMGFPAYFLVVADLVRYAKTAGIRVGPGRGSAAGCMVAYVLGITELDPDHVRADLRALPQPGPGLHARHRHGLRRAPSHRHDSLRDRALRRRQGRPDHHVRHDQGEGCDQGFLAGAGLSVRHGATRSRRRSRRPSWAAR